MKQNKLKAKILALLVANLKDLDIESSIAHDDGEWEHWSQAIQHIVITGGTKKALKKIFMDYIDDIDLWYKLNAE